MIRRGIVGGVALAILILIIVLIVKGCSGGTDVIAGKWDVDGTATLTDIPTCMKANSCYGNGAWDTVPPATASGTDGEV